MIKIIDIADTLCDQLSMNDEIKKFKIAVNLDFSLDVNVVSDTLTKESFEPSAHLPAGRVWSDCTLQAGPFKCRGSQLNAPIFWRSEEEPQGRI